MARNLEFDKEAVLAAAMQTFWTKGYRATSMVDLEKATGLKPGSIYNSFASKKGLFLAVLRYYREQVVGWRIATILNAGPPLQGIEDFFRTAYEGLEPDALIGCLLTNTATELNAEDADIRRCVADGMAAIEAAFRARLEEACRRGDLDGSADTERLALHLTSCFQGLGVIGRLTRDRDRLSVIADQAIASVR